MAYRSLHNPYSGSSSDEAWTRNVAAVRPSRRQQANISSSENESDPQQPRAGGFFPSRYNISSDSDRYNSSSEYESSDLDRNQIRIPQPRAGGVYSSSDSEEYFTEQEDASPLPIELLKKIRPKSVLGTIALLMALSLPFIDQYSRSNSRHRSLGIPKLSRLPKMFMDSLTYTASSLVPGANMGGEGSVIRPDFVYEHPYVSSSYYTSTNNTKALIATEEIQVKKALMRAAAEESSSRDLSSEIKTRLAIVRPFCEFDAEALPTTFTCWNSLPPCKAARDDIGDDEEEEDVPDMMEFAMGPDGEFHRVTNSSRPNPYESIGNERYLFDKVGSSAMKTAEADVFLFYSQTFSENPVAIKAVDAIINQFFEPGGWSRCFENIYAIEANIPQDLDLYIPSAQEDLYNWVNGPNRQYEAAFRIIQSGEWGEYDGFYLMEGDSVPIKSHWLDVLLSEIEVNRPFAVLGAQYDGDKWDNFYEKIPISLLHHTNGNAIYNTSHPLLERLVGQLEVEAPCPYNSIPYDYRMSQMWVEGTLGIVPLLAPKIMLNEEGENITLSNNTEMFSKWAEIWERENPFKYTKVIHNYAATNLIPRHLGPEYIIHGAKLYSPWDPTKTEVTLVVSEWFFDRSLHLIKSLDNKDHPFSEVVVMVPPAAITHDDYDEMTDIPVRTQHRGAPDFMDLCEADVKTEWFMITNSYHHVARHVDLMFTPGTFKPVIPFTPATYPFCFKYPYCKETVNLAQRFNPGHAVVVQDMDMLFNTKMRNEFCKEWKEQNGEEGEDMYKNQQRRLMFRKKIIGPPGPTGTSYFAWLIKEGKDSMYKMTDRSLYGARPAFIKIFAKEEKLDGMSEDELAKRVGMTLIDNSTDSDCNCMAYETEVDCDESGVGCIWRPLFESCHPPELIDGSDPICATTQAPTMSPTVSMDGLFDATESPTAATSSPTVSKDSPWYVDMFKSREHETASSSITDDTVDGTTMTVDDDDAVEEPTARRKLETETLDSLYQTDLNERLDAINSDSEPLPPLPNKQCEPWLPTIVPRHLTASKTWIGASPDPTSRSYSAMATSRPRFLHRTFLKAITGFADQSPLQDSWMTSSVLINIPKYEARRKGTELRELALMTPEMTHDSSRLYKTFVNYGDKHPFEVAKNVAHDSYKPLRITFVTDNLLEFPSQLTNSDGEAVETVTAATVSKIEAITGDILPSVSELYAGALTVVRSIGNIFPVPGSSNRDRCGEAIFPHHHLKDGVPNTDTLIYVTLNGPHCSFGITSYASVCSFDQHMRPLTGNLVICLDNIEAPRGEVSEVETLRLIASLTLQVGKMLGLSTSLFQYYINPDTGKAWGATTKTVTCVDGESKELSVPNILLSTMESADHGRGDIRHPSFEIVSPTVKQVVRNHFDCQSLSGARLDHNPASCFGEALDPRYHFDEDMVLGTTADTAFSLSPLTLALFEDSSWYKADFSKATVPLFGRGAGCGFVEGECVSKSYSVPDYSDGFFCGDVVEGDVLFDRKPSSCDYTHSHKADCEILIQKDAKDESSVIKDNSKADSQCPMRTDKITSCFDASNSPSMTGEFYSSNSRCFDTNTPESVCLQSFCNAVDSKIDIVVDGKVFQCDYEGQEVDLGDYSILCPRLAVICPHLVCPSNCSGKGICDYCRDVPVCVCDNPFDDTAGCYGDELN